MSPSKLGALCIGGAALPLLAIATIWLGDTTGPWAASAESIAQARAARTVGGVRNGYLAELTQFYVARPDAVITEAMRAGTELAPTLFLNEELERRGVKWRVRATAGSDAVTYDVS